jgi:hypothetical protein
MFDIWILNVGIICVGKKELVSSLDETTKGSHKIWKQYKYFNLGEMLK